MNQNIKLNYLFFALIIFPYSAYSQHIDSIVDKRDKKIYKIVKMGQQWWMAENLAFDTGGSWPYDKDYSNMEKFGLLYSWSAAKYVCPEGWHLPSDKEWKLLEKSMGMSEIEIEKHDAWRGTDQGHKMKSTSGWFYGGNGSNESGFNVMPAGSRNVDSQFTFLGDIALFWSSTPEGNTDAWYRKFRFGHKDIYRNHVDHESYGFSVRCVKDYTVDVGR